MEAPESYDKRIARIMSKIEDLRDYEMEDTCGEWPPQWMPPITEEQAAAFEKKHGILLPADYRRFITTIAAGGSQPFYGLEALNQKDKYKPLSDLKKPFCYTLDQPLIIMNLTQEQLDQQPDEDEIGGFLTLCTEGCGMDSILVVNSKDPNTYGTVWFCDLSDDFGIAPMRDKETGRPFCFLDWLEYWADETAKQRDDEYEYFSFGDTVQIPESPSDPEISD